MAMRLHHPDDLDAAVRDHELAERLRDVPPHVARACMRRSRGGRGRRRGTRVPGGVASPYLLDYADATFTRTGEAAAVDPRNGWAWYDLATPWPGTDVARILSDGAILIEGSRTNLATYSADLVSLKDAGASAAVDDGTGATSPDGSANSDQVRSTGTGVSNARLYSAIFTTDPATASVYVKQDTGDGATVSPSGNGATTTTEVTPDATWQRISAYESASGVNKRFNAVATKVSSGSAVLGDKHSFWGAQMEAAGFPSSPIRTSGGTATRAVDNCQMPSGWSSVLASGRFRITYWPQMDADSFAVGGNQLPVFYVDASNFLRIRYTGASWQVTLANSAGSTTVTLSGGSAAWAANDKIEITADHTTGDLSVVVGGGSPQEVLGGGAAGGSWSTATALLVGINVSGAASAWGVLSRPRAA